MDGGAARQVYCAPQRQWEDPGIHPFLTTTNGKNAKIKTTNTTTMAHTLPPSHGADPLIKL